MFRIDVAVVFVVVVVVVVVVVERPRASFLLTHTTRSQSLYTQGSFRHYPVLPGAPNEILAALIVNLLRDMKTNRLLTLSPARGPRGLGACRPLAIWPRRTPVSLWPVTVPLSAPSDGPGTAL